MNFFQANFKLIISILIIVFLTITMLNHFFKDYLKLNPFYRNNILLEGFDGSGNDTSGNLIESTPITTSDNVIATTPISDNAVATSSSAPITTSDNVVATSSSTPITTGITTSVSTTPVAETSDTDKSTIMADLFEKVNSQMDIIRTLKLSDVFVPINIDKAATEPFVILTNLKLLINNGIYKNELDLKDIYDKYIGNKAVQILASDINSVNMGSSVDVSLIETTFLKRCQQIVDAHQKLIDKILDNKSKE